MCKLLGTGIFLNVQQPQLEPANMLNSSTNSVHMLNSSEKSRLGVFIWSSGVNVGCSECLTAPC